jgi:hypothetical protein
MDAALHAERLDRGRKRVHPTSGLVSELPDGAVIIAGGHAFTLVKGRAFRWTERGYKAVRQFPRADGLLTPPSTLLAMRAGYRPVLHPDLQISRVDKFGATRDGFLYLLIWAPEICRVIASFPFWLATSLWRYC